MTALCYTGNNERCPTLDMALAHLRKVAFFLFGKGFLVMYFIYLLILAALGLHHSTWVFSGCCTGVSHRGGLSREAQPLGTGGSAEAAHA